MKNNFYTPLVLLFMLTGCAINNVPPADIYTLSPKWNDTKVRTESKKNCPLILKMAPVRATQALIGNDIFYTDAQYVQNSYAYSRWNNAPVKLLPILFQVSIEESHLFEAIIPPTSISKSDLVLESTLLELNHHIKNNGSSEGVIRIRFYLINNATRKIIATKEFVSKVPAATKNAKGAVEALNKAATDIAHNLVIWLAKFDKF
ncbi:MAG: hypothetical protein GQ532_19030 [Methylomarinum sp.]|nr:membrane integrity-associated transporter subunit PqiC [Methylococcales bacterium]NOR71751.1 hypothetical protein [Methylomarinum sp.]